MADNLHLLTSQYEQQGYVVMRDYFSADEIASLREVILRFHRSWKHDNAVFYQQEAFNASLITGSQHLVSADRLALFNFISCPKIMRIVDALIPCQPAFMNTQLFFDPYSKSQANFWHRDCQYDFDIEDQKRMIQQTDQQTQVVHLRIPLFDEPGMELVPGTHKRWDSDEEFNVRQEQHNRLSSDNLSCAKKVKLAAGDLLLFSADMLHRGLYGNDRLAFDILVFDPRGNYADYVDPDCLPSNAMLAKISNPALYMNTLHLKANG